jgi:hypothetical protein
MEVVFIYMKSWLTIPITGKMFKIRSAIPTQNNSFATYERDSSEIAEFK